MEAGRELDALIAQHVMGIKVDWRWARYIGDSFVVFATEGEGKEDGGPDYPPIYEPCYLFHDHRACLEELERSIPWTHGDRYDYKPVLEYSTDIAAAWQVVERFTDVVVERAGGNYQVTIGAWAVADAKTPVHAICLAALRATEHYS